MVCLKKSSTGAERSNAEPKSEPSQDGSQSLPNGTDPNAALPDISAQSACHSAWQYLRKDKHPLQRGFAGWPDRCFQRRSSQAEYFPKLDAIAMPLMSPFHSADHYHCDSVS
jgi:hypothetical protein